MNDKIVIIGCGMLKADLQPLIDNLTYDHVVIWLDEKLHDTPSELNKAIQNAVDFADGSKAILLTYLLCGNALLGIRSSQSPIRFIKGDDCICACMKNTEGYSSYRPRSVFLSKGWLSSERNPLDEYQRVLSKYGQKRTDAIYSAMYGNYRSIIFMKLHENEIPTADERERLSFFSEKLSLKLEEKLGSLELYRSLLQLEDNPDIAVIPPGSSISLRDAGIFI